VRTLMVTLLLAISTYAAALAAGPRKGDFMQDYVTCDLWMDQQAAGAQMHVAGGRWIVDALRQHSPPGLPQFSDGQLVEIVEQYCKAQPSHTLSVATFLAGQRLPD